MATKGMISPFEPKQVRRNESGGIISYGLSSFGYDIRLSPEEFRVFRYQEGSQIDPKNFTSEHLEKALLQFDENGTFFILPGHSYGRSARKYHGFMRWEVNLCTSRINC